MTTLNLLIKSSAKETYSSAAKPYPQNVQNKFKNNHKNSQTVSDSNFTKKSSNRQDYIKWENVFPALAVGKETKSLRQKQMRPF